MPFLKKLPADAKVFDAFKTWPHIYDAWTETCQQILRESPSSLTAAERELIGTFVSKLNQCHYCYSVHNSAAKAYGYDPALVTNLVENVETAPVGEKLKPMLRYVRKLTLDQSRMVQADADAVYAAGWSEDDLHIAIAITGPHGRRILPATIERPAAPSAKNAPRPGRRHRRSHQASYAA
jgi:uncharacterized peroxidase-related enzyme